MHPYLLLLAAATLISAACGGALFLHHRRHWGSQLSGLLFVGVGIWNLCQLLACLAPDPVHADLWFRLGGFGCLYIGPLALHIFMEAAGGQHPRIRVALGGLYGSATALLLAALFTDLILVHAEPAPWGYYAVAGPLFFLANLNAMIGVTLGVTLFWRKVEQFSEAERRQLPWFASALALPVVVSSVTDSLLPTLGIPFPTLGSIALACMSVVTVWIVVHYGYSMLTPGPFATEILALLPDGVAMLRPDERIRSANEGLARLSGRSVEDLEGQHIGELLSWSFEAEEFDEVDCELLGTGGNRVPVSVSASALRDRQGNVLGRVLIVRDLREVADLRRRLVTSARLAAVGELAAGVAHEINNPLAYVRSNLSQFDQLWKQVRSEIDAAGRTEAIAAELTDIEELVAESLEGVDRAAEIVRGVKNFAHAGSARRELADLNQLLDDVVRVSSPQLRGRAEVETVYSPIPEIHCSPQQLRQVFLNLVLNASQAIEGSGTIHLSTMPIDGGVEVIVEDDGVGISPEVIDRIFDPFFTTKPVGEGTGLGLGIAYQIVEQHRGKITVESTPGVGTRFRVHLPID